MTNDHIYNTNCMVASLSFRMAVTLILSVLRGPWYVSSYLISEVVDGDGFWRRFFLRECHNHGLAFRFPKLPGVVCLNIYITLFQGIIAYFKTIYNSFGLISYLFCGTCFSIGLDGRAKACSSLHSSILPSIWVTFLKAYSISPFRQFLNSHLNSELPPRHIQLR